MEMRGNVQLGTDKEKFSPVLTFSTIKVVMSAYKKRKWHPRHFDVHNVFLDVRLHRPFHVELPKVVYDNAFWTCMVMSLRRSRCGFKDAAHIWHDLNTKDFKKEGLEELESAPYVYTRENMIIGCHLHDILMFADHQSDINKLKQLLERKFISRDLQKPIRFPGMEINWEIPN